MVLPLGNGAFYQQSRSNGDINVDISWWDGHIKNRHNAIKAAVSSITKDIGTKNSGYTQYGDTDALLQSKMNIPIGLEASGCTGRMLVEFKAIRDIEIGEELGINLIKDPVTGFKFIGDRNFTKYCL